MDDYDNICIIPECMPVTKKLPVWMGDGDVDDVDDQDHVKDEDYGSDGDDDGDPIDNDMKIQR